MDVSTNVVAAVIVVVVVTGSAMEQLMVKFALLLIDPFSTGLQ